MAENPGKRELPLQPNLERLRKDAKARLAAMRRANPAARLTDAQAALAADYGFDSWAALKHEAERRAHSTRAARARHFRRDSEEGPDFGFLRTGLVSSVLLILIFVALLFLIWLVLRPMLAGARP